jgi:hypothetical protein
LLRHHGSHRRCCSTVRREGLVHPTVQRRCEHLGTAQIRALNYRILSCPIAVRRLASVNGIA